MAFPKVIISVLNWNHADETINCIHSLEKTIYFNFELVIVDNHSSDHSFERLCDVFPSYRVIKAKHNDGYAAGHKIVADIAIEEQADLLWILNNDLTVRPDTLSELVSAYEMHGSAIYGSVTLLSENPDIINFGGGQEFSSENPDWSHDIFNREEYNECYKLQGIRDVQTVDGCSIMIPLSLIKTHGFMDTTWFMYGEETDYCFTMRKKAIPSYVVCRSSVIHKGSGSFAMEEKLNLISSYYRRRNYIRFKRKHFSLSINDSLKLSGGAWSLIKFFIKYCISCSEYRSKNEEEYYQNIASLHGVLGLKGKILSPERFLNDKTIYK